MKEMGTMKHEQIRETLIGVLRFEILRNKGGGLYQICYYALLGVGGGGGGQKLQIWMLRNY